MPTKPEFEIGDKLKSYTAEWKGSEWEIKGERRSYLTLQYALYKSPGIDGRYASNGRK